MPCGSKWRGFTQCITKRLIYMQATKQPKTNKQIEEPLLLVKYPANGNFKTLLRFFCKTRHYQPINIKTVFCLIFVLKTKIIFKVKASQLTYEKLLEKI